MKSIPTLSMLMSIILLVSASTVMADSQVWDWVAGDCYGSPGAHLYEQVIDIEPGTEVCVRPPGHLYSTGGFWWYEGVYINGQWYPESTTQQLYCRTITGSQVTVSSSTVCTVETSRQSGVIYYTPPSGPTDCTCSTCSECTTKLNDPACSVVTLTANVSAAGTCINNPAGFNNKVFDGQGHTITNSGNSVSAITAYSKSGNTIKNCVISVTSAEWASGIGMTGSNNLITSNTVTSSGQHSSGIVLSSSSTFNTVSSNTITTSGFNSWPIYLYQASDNNILGNEVNFSGGSTEGIRVYYSDDNFISNNEIHVNSGGSYAMKFWDSDGNVAQDNTIDGLTGIELDANSQNNDLYSNRICTSGNDIIDYGGNDGTSQDDENTCDNTVNWDDLGTTGCTDGCSSTYCGDAVVQSPNDEGQFEECDDGNSDHFDDCRNDCTLPYCGDGIQDADEECDDGNAVNTDDCRNDCTLPYCGDGIIDPGEECDDGNNDPGDGCDPDCITEVCGCVGATQVFQCGDIITEDCVMNCDLSTAGSCFTLQDLAIAVDCDGHSITGTRGGGSKGFLVQANSTQIQDCTIKDFDIGVRLENATGGIMAFNTIEGCGYGASLYNTSSYVIWENEFRNNTSPTSWAAGIIIATGSAYNNVYDNYIHDNEKYGIRIESGTTDNNIHNNESCDNGFADMSLFSGMTYNAYENKCDTTDNFDDSGYAGCQYDCPVECDDANLDGLGSVDLSDYSIVADDWLQTGTLDGDINGDGTVNINDLKILALYWLDTCTP